MRRRIEQRFLPSPERRKCNVHWPQFYPSERSLQKVSKWNPQHENQEVLEKRKEKVRKEWITGKDSVAAVGDGLAKEVGLQVQVDGELDVFGDLLSARAERESLQVQNQNLGEFLDQIFL